MVRAKRQGLFQGRSPVGRTLPGQAVHQVQAQVLESGIPGRPHRAPGLPGRVDPAEHGQLTVIEGLDADGQPVAPGPAQPLEPGRVDGARIDLHAHLGLVVGKGKEGAAVGKQLRQVGRVEQRRGAAAEKDGGENQFPHLRLSCQGTQVGAHRRQVAADLARPGHHRGEAAVGAFAPAEGDVQVDAGPAAEVHQPARPSRRRQSSRMVAISPWSAKEYTWSPAPMIRWSSRSRCMNEQTR